MAPTHQPIPSICRIDDLTVDRARRKVLRKTGEPIELSALSFDTLLALIDASPEVLASDKLIQLAWRGSLVSDETVTQRIRLLRKALQDDRRNPRYIETVRNVGYRLIPPVVEVKSVRKRPGVTVSLIVAGILAASLLAYALRPSLNNTANDIDETLTTDAPPLIPQGPVTAADLADQAADLIQQRNQDSLRHAIELLEEALLLDPHSPSLRASLSSALSKSVAWYGDKMDVAVRAEQLARDALADGAFFQGEFALGFSLDAQGRVEPARAAYERAVALEPGHAGARASLAYLLQVQGKLVEALSHNFIAYRQSTPGTLDTQIASCLRLLGFSAAASEWLERSDRLDPDSAHAAPSRALDLLTRGNFEQARAVIDRAIERGIDQVELYEYRVVLALLNDDVGAAKRIIDSVPASISHRAPVHVWRQVVQLRLGGASTAAIELADELRTTIAGGVTWPDTYLYIAMIESEAGRDEEAIAALENLLVAGYRDHLWLELLPSFDALQSDPRFRRATAAMLEDVNRQRAIVLTADWLPAELKTNAEPVNP